MDTTLPLTRRDLLRRATAQAHARIDGLLSGGFHCTQAYGQYVRGMHRFACDGMVALASDPGADRVARGRDCLEADLRDLGLAPLPAPAARLNEAAGLAERLGWHYVVAGSSLGARFLLRDALNLGLQPARGARFLAHHAQGDDWREFLSRLQDAPLSTQDLPRMCAAARRAFEAAHAAMVAARHEEIA